MLRIGLADDHPVIMDALESVFVEAGGFGVVFKARTGAQLIEALRAHPCDAVVTDYSMTQGMSGGDGLALIAQLLRQFPTVRVIVFTMLANPALCEQLAALGVHGIVSKSDDRAEVLAAMRALSAGGEPPILSPGVRASTRRYGTTRTRTSTCTRSPSGRGRRFTDADRGRHRWERAVEVPLVVLALAFLAAFAWPVLEPDLDDGWRRVCRWAATSSSPTNSPWVVHCRVVASWREVGGRRTRQTGRLGSCGDLAYWVASSCPG